MQFSENTKGLRSITPCLSILTHPGSLRDELVLYTFKSTALCRCLLTYSAINLLTYRLHAISTTQWNEYFFLPKASGISPVYPLISLFLICLWADAMNIQTLQRQGCIMRMNLSTSYFTQCSVSSNSSDSMSKYILFNLLLIISWNEKLGCLLMIEFKSHIFTT